MLLGDLTDAKDRHSAHLVNQIVDSLSAVAKRIPEVVLIAGNHDWLLRDESFFRFLNHIPNVRFLTRPTEDDLDERRVMFLPYSKNPRSEWSSLDLQTFAPDLVFMHQTVGGSIASNGEAMEGEDLPLLPATARVYSGDIHVPQVVRMKDGPEVTYVGSPYHVHFGDDFKPRVLMLDRRCREHWLSDFKSPRRVSLKVGSLRELRHAQLNPGDQIKLRFDLSAEDHHQWIRIKREAVAILEEQQVVIAGVKLEPNRSKARGSNVKLSADLRSPAMILSQYADRDELPGSVLDVGLDLMEGLNA